MTGLQVAVEGYVHEGEVTVYGVLDSINYPGSSCFLRHQYPSMLLPGVIRRLHEVRRRMMRQIGMDADTFSIEYFYDSETDEISLLEMNPRHSQDSYSYSYEVAHIFTGADDEKGLRRKFDQCVAASGLTFDETAPGGCDREPP